MTKLSQLKIGSEKLTMRNNRNNICVTKNILEDEKKRFIIESYTNIWGNRNGTYSETKKIAKFIKHTSEVKEKKVINVRKVISMQISKLHMNLFLKKTRSKIGRHLNYTKSVLGIIWEKVLDTMWVLSMLCRILRFPNWNEQYSCLFRYFK